MARTTAEIEASITDAVQTDAVLSTQLTSTSQVAVWRRWARIVAEKINMVENLWDAFKREILDIIARLKPHSLRYYAELALKFQLGFPRIVDSDTFDNTGYTLAQIEASKVVKHVAVTEEVQPGLRTHLRMKLAGASAADLVQLPAATVTAIKGYFTKAKDAGVPMVIESLPPDKTIQEWVIHYDPTILAANGTRLDGTAAEPAREAIAGYLKKLPFNGLYVPTLHIDEVQKVEGVVIPVQTLCLASYGNLQPGNVGHEYQPDAGWMRFLNVNDLTITYQPHDAIER